MRRLNKTGRPCPGGSGLMGLGSEPTEGQQGVFLIDREGHVVFFNSLFRPLTGISLEKIVGMHYLDIVSPEELDLVRGSFERVMRGQEITSLELACKSLPGAPLTLEIMAKPVFKDNRVIALHGFIKNIMLEKAEGKFDFHTALEGVIGDEGREVVDPLQGDHVTEKDFSHEDFRKGVDELKSRFHGLAAEVSDLHRRLLGEIEEREQMERELKRKDREIAHMAKNLQEADAIQNALIKRGEDDRKALEQNVIRNMEQLVEPSLEKLKSSSLDETQRRLISALETNIKEITTSFSHHLSSPHFKLTPTELQIADFIRQGRDTKEIAGLMNLSHATVRTHRGNIRRKLDIRNTKTNLRSYLLAHF